MKSAEQACDEAVAKQNNPAITDANRIRAAEEVSQEWTNCRRNRCSLLLPALVFTANRAVDEVRNDPPCPRINH